MTDIPKIAIPLFNLPDWAKWVGVDSDGRVSVFSHKPTWTCLGEYPTPLLAWVPKSDDYCRADLRHTVTKKKLLGKLWRIR